MGEVNNIVCDYLGLPGYYADFWNGTVFRGKRKIRIWQLRRHDREYYKTKNKSGKTGNVRRDVQMHCKGKKDILLGIEVMDTLDYTIPVRVMDYNVQELQRQVKDIRQRNRMEKKLPPGVYLHGLKKTDKLLPVHTICLYCGTDVYDGPCGIMEMMDVEGLSKEYKNLLKDYRVKIYNLKELEEENYETSLREIIAIFKRSKDREAMKQYYLEYKERFRELDEISIDTMGVLIGKKSLKLFPQEGGGLDLCKAFEDEREEGRVQGREEGRIEGKVEGKAEGERIGREMGAFAMLSGLVKDGLLKMEDAAKRMNMTEEMFFKKMQDMN